jgi:hypothetical protein
MSDRPTLKDTEIAVTAEMIEAGIDMLATKDPDYDDDGTEIVVKIYRAMSQAKALSV